MEHFDYNEKVYTKKDMGRQGGIVLFALSLMCAFVGGLFGVQTLEVGPLAGFLHVLLIAGGLFLCGGVVYVFARVIAMAMEETKAVAKVAVWFAVLVVAYVIGRFALPNILGLD